jgi:hypothetical protein
LGEEEEVGSQSGKLFSSYRIGCEEQRLMGNPMNLDSRILDVGLSANYSTSLDLLPFLYNGANNDTLPHSVIEA